MDIIAVAEKFEKEFRKIWVELDLKKEIQEAQRKRIGDLEKLELEKIKAKIKINESCDMCIYNPMCYRLRSSNQQAIDSCNMYR